MTLTFHSTIRIRSGTGSLKRRGEYPGIKGVPASCGVGGWGCEAGTGLNVERAQHTSRNGSLPLRKNPQIAAPR
jgi:hypothetical protein